MFTTILKYDAKNIFRSKWIILYSILFFVITEGLFRLSGTTAKVHISLMNIMLITVPLISIVFGTMHVYSSREFTELLLSQPVQRKSVFLSSFFSINTALGGAFIFGSGIPLFFHTIQDGESLRNSILLLVNGGLITIIFTGLAYIVAITTDEKSKGFGLILLIWLFTSILYDALLLLLLFLFRDYPTDYPALILSFLNPIDLSRISLSLVLDQSALMGYTGALYRSLYGSGTGIVLSLGIMLVWAFIPFLWARKRFLKKDY